MKSSKKVLAFALAAAMVVTAVPATNAQAAAKTAKLSSKTVTVAVGSAKKQTKSIKVVTPSNWKNVKVKVSSSNKKVATVKATGKTVKVTGVKKGTAKVTVKVTAKKGKKHVKKTLSDKEVEELVVAVTPYQGLIHVEHCELSHMVSSGQVR